MLRRIVTNPKIIVAILILQFIPLILFPAATFSATSQEWWLPALLTVMSIIAVIELFANRATVAGWAWQLVAFAQGFNLISRMLMLFPRMTENVKGVQRFNALYVVLTLIAMAMSAFILWFIELPEVKVGLLKEESVS